MNRRHTVHRSLRGALVAPVLAALTLGVLAASVAQAQPDLEITAMSVQGTPRQGACNTVAMTVRNSGNQFTNVASIDIFLATFPQGNPSQNRAEKSDIMISPLQAGNQVSFNVTDVDFKAQGAMTVQALVDSTNKVAESNENNNTRILNVNVAGECYTPEPPPPPPAPTCDLQAKFTAPSGTSLPGGQSTQFTIAFSNPSNAGPCERFRVNLSRYSNRRCGGRGVRVGGSRAWESVAALGPGQSATVTFSEKAPSRGTFCYKLGYSPHAYNTKTNSHRPQKVVQYN